MNCIVTAGPTFEPLDDVVDTSVGGQVQLDLERGGKAISAKLPVGDLHAITPDSYLQFGDGVLNTLSYQLARQFNVPVKGVYVANPGYALGAAGIAHRTGKRTYVLAAVTKRELKAARVR